MTTPDFFNSLLSRDALGLNHPGVIAGLDPATTTWRMAL
jgi:hypothetical protein